MNNPLTRLLIFVLIFQSCSSTDTERINLLEKENDDLKTKVDSLNQLLDEEQTLSNDWFDSELIDSQFLHLGITRPKEFIAQSLREKQELIPIQGVLGGEMNFDKIQPIGWDWVIADYHDGHVYGMALYKYQFNDVGELTFELIAVANDE